MASLLEINMNELSLAKVVKQIDRMVERDV